MIATPMMTEMQLLTRECPKCGISMTYRTKQGWVKSERTGAACRKCYGKRMSTLLKGKPKSTEHRRKLSDARIGKPGHPMSTYTKTRLMEAVKGKPKTEEHKRKLSEAKRGRLGVRTGAVLSEETKHKISASLTGKKATGEARAKMSAAKKGKKLRPWSIDRRKRASEQRKGRKHTEESKRKMSERSKGKTASEETKRKRSETMKRLYATTDLHRKVMEGIKRNSRGGKKECPNRFERQLAQVLQESFPNEYKFVGDGSVVIGGLNPDFININGQKKIIELFGELYHKASPHGWKIPENRTEEGRKAAFKAYGFKTLIVWCAELKSTAELKTKLVSFHNT